MANSDLTLVLGGDLHVQRPHPESIFDHVITYLRQADILFGNLEAPITDAGQRTWAGEGMSSSERMLAEGVISRLPDRASGELRSDEAMVSAYTQAGFAAVGLANSGGMSLGAEGLLRCIEVLEAAGIAHAGGGRNREEAHRAAIVERGGTRVAFLSYSSVVQASAIAAADQPGLAAVRVATMYEPRANLASVPGSPPIIHTVPNAEDTAAMAADVRRAKEETDVVVVSWHWGLSRLSGGDSAGKVIGYQVELAHAAIDAGADLIVGHHPHMLEAIEVYRGKAVFYSLGNFAFDFYADRELPVELTSFALVRCVVRDRAIQSVSFVPTRIPNEDPRPVILDTTAGEDIVRRLRELSARFDTRFHVGEKAVLVDTGAAVAAAG